MEFPRKSQSCDCQNDDCKVCSASNEEVCFICGHKILSESLSNDMHIAGSLPDNICQCFFSDEIKVPDVVINRNEQNVQVAVPISESQTVTLQEKSYISESSDVSMKDYVNSSDEKSTIPEYSYSSNGYVSSLENFRMNSSPSSGEDSKNISNIEKGYSSSGYALSLDEQSFDQNLTDHRNNTSSSGEDSKNSPKIGKEETNRRSPVESAISTNSGYKAGSDGYRCSESSPSEQEHKDNRSTNSESTMKNIKNKNIQYEPSSSPELGKFNIRNLNTGYPNIRPQLPRPFPKYQPYGNPVMPAPRFSQPYPQSYAQHYPQPFQPYAYPEVNAPLIGANVAERFSIVTSPQTSTSYQQNPDNERGGLSKQLLAKAQEVDSEGNVIKKDERIKNWLHEVECVPPDEEPSNSNCASGWSIAENEGISPIYFSGTSTDERSSTEKSEEENRRQRALRKPPRKLKKR